MAHHLESESVTVGSPGKGDPITFTISAEIAAFSISPDEFLRSRPDLQNLIAGAMVFRHRPGNSVKFMSLETLLLQRAPSESFPLKWEIPAGTADPSIDLSIFGVAVRELWEETQLRARNLACSVGLGLANGVTNLVLTGEAEDARMDSDLNLCLLRVSGLTWAIVTFIADVEDGNQEVVLRPDEHTAWAWVNEDEVTKERFRGQPGKDLQFVSEAMRETVLEGFRLRKNMCQAAQHQ